MKISKVLTAALATASMMATGLVAVAPAAAAPMGETIFDVNVARTFNATTPVTVRPGESITVSVGFTVDERNTSPATNSVTDIAVGDVITYAENIVTTLTLSYTPTYSWYAAGNAGCYTEMNAQGSDAEITWSAELEACAPGYLSVYRQLTYTNNTQTDATIAASPTLTTTGSAGEWLDADQGININMNASMNKSNVTSYTAIQGDTRFSIDPDRMCVSRDLATGDRFRSVLNVSNGSANLGTVSGSGAYISSLQGNGINGDWSTVLNDTVPIQSWSRSNNRVSLNTAEPHGMTQPSRVTIENTGVPELDAITSDTNTYMYVEDADSLFFYASGDVVAETALTEGTVSFEGELSFAVPAEPTSMIVYVGGSVWEPVAGETYEVETDLVSAADSSVSVQRPCGLAAPSFTVGSPSYNSIPVTISGVADASSYQCRAQQNGVTVGSTGYLNEATPLSPAGGTCTITGLSQTTTYQISVSSYSSVEGAGAWSAATSATTTSGGGGGVPTQVLPVMSAITLGTTPVALVNATRTMGSAAVVSSASRGYNGGNGDVFYANVTSGNLVITRNLTTGPDTRFAGTGSVQIAGVANVTTVTWMGTSASSWVANYRDSNMNTVFKWGKLTSSTTKTQSVTSAQVAAFCRAQFGAAYTAGNASVLSSPIEAPVVVVSCFSMTDMTLSTESALASIKVSSTAPLNAITKLSSSTDAQTLCTTTSIGRNPVAKTTTTAAMLIVATTYPKTNGSCMLGSSNATKREVFAIGYTTSTTTAPKVLKKTTASSTQIVANGGQMYIAPGSAANTWVGLVNTGSMGPSVPNHLFTIDAKGAVKKGKNVVFDSTNSGNAAFSSYSFVIPTKGVTTSTLVGYRTGSAMQMVSGSNQSYAPVTISLVTGKVVTGKVQTITAENYTGTSSGQNMNNMVSTVDHKKMNFFTLVDNVAKTYKTVTWTQATR